MALGFGEQISLPRNTSKVRSELLNPSKPLSKMIAEAIAEIDKLCFGATDAQLRRMQREIQDPTAIVSILKRGKKVVGYSYALPDPAVEGAVYIHSTAIHPSEQHKGLVGKLMAKMEAEMRRRGFSSFTRDCMIDNGYADTVQRHYGDRIIKMFDRFFNRRSFQITL
ncbi:MAG: GNAT family N-acetyltransferase [Patescibacteria group bacterium]